MLVKVFVGNDNHKCEKGHEILVKLLNEVRWKTMKENSKSTYNVAGNLGLNKFCLPTC